MCLYVFICKIVFLELKYLKWQVIVKLYLFNDYSNNCFSAAFSQTDDIIIIAVDVFINICIEIYEVDKQN
jgi:hypothetical protein